MTRPLKEMKNFLKEVPIFSELDDQALDFLAKKASEKTYPRDSIIIRRREWGTSLLILRSGEVKVILEKKTGGEVTLSTLKKGDFFGELSLLDGKARSATVIAMEDSTIVEIEKEVLKEMFKSSGFSFKFLEEIAGRFRNTDDSIRKFADRVCSDAYTSLDEILKSQLESAKIFFQKTEDRASKTIDQVESSRKTLTLIAYIITGMFSLIGGGLGYLGVTKYSDISEMHKEAIYSYNDIQKTKAEVQDAKSLSDIVLDIRKFREDVMLDKDIGDLKMHELKSSGVHHHFFKKPLFKYLDKREEYEPEVRLEAIKTILDLHYKHDIELVTSEKEKILDALLGVLEATESRDWGTQLVVRKMLEKLTKDNDQLKNSISRDLKHILSDISAREHVKFNAARMLATLDVRHEKVKSLLKEKIEKEIPMRSGVNFRAITASIALIEIGDDAGLEYILNKINDGGKKESYWAAFFLGELLWVKKSDERVFEILKQRLVDKGFSNQKLTKKMKEGINYLKQQEVPLNNYYVKYFSLISEELNNSGS